MADIPHHLDIAGTAFTLIDAPEPIACWTASLEAAHGGSSPTVNIIVEPAAEPGPEVLRLTAEVIARFGELADVAGAYLREELREPGFGLRDDELQALRSDQPPFGEPEAVIWDDGGWMLRFTESPLELADPYGIGVLFEGMTPSAVEDLSDPDPA
ncbi:MULTISPECIES: hypothetical protein [Arthrobacter]|uniref:hypothetical protein n=1 Tax=Arthrobacter TaxID=1663 RepID=UPI00241ECD35|nr:MULTISPECIES: hypothetical protein [Arthrobacter]MDQ0707375.1 hypothetical protein [Arthrobacter woluwensis]WFR84255.1 hypothetical protein P9849_01010 [Arthrobacter sp. Y-9]